MQRLSYFAFVLATVTSAADGNCLLAQPIPLDPVELQVNAVTPGRQASSHAAVFADGSFIVVWASEASSGSDSSGYSIQARLFGSGPGPLAEPEFQVNSYTTGDQSNPRVASDGAGNFVVVWDSEGSFGDDQSQTSVQARRFGANGAPLDSTEFQINAYSTGSQAGPRVAAALDGGFAVVWVSDGSFGNDTSYSSVQVRRFSAGGLALDPLEFQVNAFTTDDQGGFTDVSMAADGRFVVAWSSYGSFGNDDWFRSIQRRRFGADGTPMDSMEFQVNAYTAYDQRGAHVSMAPDGSFVVAWTSDVTNGNDTHIGVQARRFSIDGAPLDAEEFQANVYTNTAQLATDVAGYPEGDFVVAWQTVATAGNDQDGSVQARRFRADGSAVDDLEFQLNTYTTSIQGSARLAARAGGDFVAVWSSRGSFGTDASYSSVQGRRFGRPTIPVTSTSGGTGGSNCTLRDAVAAANSGAAVGACDAGNEGGVVSLPAGATIELSEVDNGANALPQIARPVTIKGNGARIVRDPGLACPEGPDLRLFEVGDGGVLTLEDVTVANGCMSNGDGGGVLAEDGTLVLRRANIEGNEAGGAGGGVAISGGNLLAFDSDFSDNLARGGGGGVAVAGDPGWVWFSGSTFAANAAGSGGALAHAGDAAAVLRNSTVAGNVAWASGGGIEVGSTAAETAPELAVEFSTVTGNSSPEGAAVHAAEGVLALHGSLVGESAVGPDCGAGYGTLTASGANLDSDGTCAALAGGNVATVASFGLGPLAWNGGPTRTRAPFAGSPALDAAPDCATRPGAWLGRDQRGHARPTDDDFDLLPECDLGSVELGYLFLDGFENGSTGNWSFTVP